jgi:hypothetical protein
MSFHNGILHSGQLSGFCPMSHIQEQDRQCMYNITLRHVHITFVAVAKQQVFNTEVCICICSFVNRHTNHILYVQYYIVICGLSGCTLFFALSHKWHNFQKIFIEHKMCVLISSTTFASNLSHSKKNSARDIITIILKYPLFLSHFNQTWIFTLDVPLCLYITRQLSITINTTAYYVYEKSSMTN